MTLDQIARFVKHLTIAIERDDSLKKQIRRLIVRGDDLASKLEDMYGNHNLVVTWKEESDRAAELIK